MKKSGVLTASGVLAAVLALTIASTVMAADTATVASAETDAISPQLNANEKSHVSGPDLSAETVVQGGCCACPPDPTVTGDVYVGPANKYIFRGNRLNSSDSFVIQGGVDLTYKDFTLSYWTNAQNRNTGYRKAKVSENDIILDYAVPYALPFASKLKFNIGTQYFALDGIEDTNEFYVKASYDTLLTPTLTAYWDNLVATRAGMFFTAAISHQIEIEHNLLNLNLGALVSYNQRNPSAAVDFKAVADGSSDGCDGAYNGFHDYELTARIDYTPTGNITISPSYQYSNALSSKARNIAGIHDQNVFAIKVLFSF